MNRRKLLQTGIAGAVGILTAPTTSEADDEFTIRNDPKNAIWYMGYGIVHARIYKGFEVPTWEEKEKQLDAHYAQLKLNIKRTLDEKNKAHANL